jgi:hypothetical protein
MAAIPITITDAKVDEASATITGNLSLTGLSVGGGPIYPPEVSPPDPGKPPGVPTFPIWGPPGMELPDVPGYPPVAGHPLPPAGTPIPPKPPLWIPAWIPGIGWVVIPGFPHPTPSKK